MFANVYTSVDVSALPDTYASEVPCKNPAYADLHNNWPEISGRRFVHTRVCTRPTYSYSYPTFSLSLLPVVANASHYAITAVVTILLVNQPFSSTILYPYAHEIQYKTNSLTSTLAYSYSDSADQLDCWTITLEGARSSQAVFCFCF
jgi:hypothetical protein